MHLLSSILPVLVRLAGRVRAGLVMLFCLAVSVLMPMAALAQSATVVVNPSTFTAAGQQLTFTYTVNPGSFSITSITAVSQVKSIPITCQTPNDTNPFTCSGVYTVDALDDMSGSLTDIVAFSGTRVGGNFSFMGPNVTVLKSGGGPVSLDVSTSPNPSIPGSNVTVTVSLSSMGCNAGVLPSGPVSVTVGPDTRNVTPVPPFPGASGGSVSYTLSTLPTGSHPVSASFAATSGCAAGSFSGLTHTVEPQPTVTIGTAVQSGDSLAFPVTFSVPVTGFTASDVTVNSTAGGTTTVVTGSGASYTATISGMTLAGNVEVSVAANRASSAAGSRNLASNTSTFAYTPMTIDAVTVPAPLYNQPYSFGPFTVTNGTGPFNFTISSGPLPSGIALSPGGSLSGTTRQTGPFTFTVRAQDANGRVALRTFSFSITAPTISLTPATLPDGTVGTAYSETVNASGGATPYSYAVTSGTLPTGLSLNTASGSLTGTPTAAGTFSFGITATDGGGFTATQNYSVTIGATVPGVPQGVSVSLSDLSVTISFSPPVSDGGSPVVDYSVVFFTSTQLLIVPGVQSPATVHGLAAGVEYSISVRARNAIGTGPESAPVVVTPKAAQTITFDNPGAQTFGTSPTLAATASSGLPVSFASTTPAVCTTTTTGQLTFNTSGTCTIQADQAGNTTFAAAVAVAQSFAVNPVAPSAPPAPVATAGDTMATVSFTAPASNGGSLITGYQVTSSPEGITANGVASPILVSGLTNGISYTFTVRAENAAGFGPDSAPSNAVTPQASQTITFANPGAQIQFTTPTLTASASSGLPVAFASTTPGVCSISSAGQLTLSTPGICTIEASQAGSAAYLPASPVSQSFEVLIPPPIATDSAVSVPFNSVGNVIPAVLSGGPATNIILVTGPAHGTLIVGGGLTATYTPTAGFFGTDSFSYFAINSTGNSNPATVTITVLPPTPAITPSTLSAGRVASPYSASFNGSNGIGPYTFAVTSGSLPGGLTLATNGTLSGTPTTAGSFPFTVTVTDGASGSTASVDVTLQIDEQLPIAGNNTIIVAANSADNPVTLNLSGGAATAVNVTTPPANGTVTVTGTTVTYTPTAGFSGTDFFFYTASNAGGTSSEGVIGIQISPPILSISPSVLPQARVGVPYFVVLTGDLGTAPYNFRFSGGGLPAGITLAPDGTLSGTPLGAGVVPFAVNVFDALGAMGGAALDITVLEAFPIAANSSLTVAANAGATPVPLALSGGPVDTITVTSPPQHGTATVSGASVTYTPTPGYSGTDSFAYIAANTDGTSGEATVSITVTPPVLTVAPSTLPAGRVGTAFSASFTADLGTAPYSFAVTAGALPAGLTLGTDGTLSGTPTADGSFAFTVTATDANGATGSVATTLVIDLEIPVAADSSLTVAANAGATPVPLALSGGAATSLAITTAPLHGTATVSGTTISYTPTPGYSGPDSLAYTASNAGGVSAPATVSITVTPPVLTVAPSTLPSGRVGTALSATFTADLGTAPYSFAVTSGTLPAGLTLAADGTLTGTPTADGSFAFTITATDANGATGSVATTLVIDLEIPVAAASSLTVAANAGATPVPLALSGGAATSLAITTAPLHGTATVSGTTISYTPTPGYSGPDSLAYTASNAGGVSAPATVSVTVTPPVLTVAPSTLPAGRVGTALSATFTADLGTAPYSFAVTAGALPAGLTLGTDGTLSGTPTADGSFAFTVTATDALGSSGAVAITLLIDPPHAPVVPKSFTATVVSEGTIIIDVAEGATGEVMGGQVLGVTPPEAGNAVILPPSTGLSSAAMPVRMQFTASAGYLGAARVDFVLIGPAGPSAAAAVQITVIPAAGPLDTGDAFGLASAQADAATRMARDRMSDLHGHMRKLRSSGCLSNAVAFSLTGPAKSSGEGGTTASVQSSQCSTLARGDVGIWATGSLSFGTWKDTSFSEALDHASRSLTLGMDYRLSDRAIAGIALSMSRDVTEIGTMGSETTNRSTGATLYLTYGLDNDFYVDGLVGAASLDFSSRRWVATDGAFALGERDGRQVYFSVAMGKDFSTDLRDLEGYLRISGSRSVLEAFTETGTISALHYQEQEVKSLVGAIGFSTSTEVELPTGTLRPSLAGELSHEFADAGTVGVSYAGLGVGTIFQRDAATRSRTELSLGIGFDFQHMNGWELDAEVGLRLNGDGVADTSVKLNWQMQF